VEVTGSNTF